MLPPMGSLAHRKLVSAVPLLWERGKHTILANNLGRLNLDLFRIQDNLLGWTVDLGGDLDDTLVVPGPVEAQVVERQMVVCGLDPVLVRTGVVVNCN